MLSLKEVWDENGDDRWVVCDICNLKFHLQCSGISYDIKQYWDINLELTYFKCGNCQEAEVDNQIIFVGETFVAEKLTKLKEMFIFS